MKLLFFICLFSTMLGFSQQVESLLQDKQLADSLFEEKLVGVANATPLNPKTLLNKNFQYGSILLNNGQTLKHKLINYDCLTDQLVWIRQPNFQIVIIDKSKVQAFSIDATTQSASQEFKKVYIKSLANADSVYVYVQILRDGAVSLYIHRKKQEALNQYENYNTYFIKRLNGDVVKFSPTKKSFYTEFEKVKTELKVAFKKEHLKLKQEIDLVKAIDIINKLVIIR